MERVNVGAVEVTALSDCLMVYPASSVYAKAGGDLDRYSKYLTDDGSVELNCACFLIRADGHTVLVDAGMGPESDGQLMIELEAAGVSADEVEMVIFTHLHGDHTGWNVDRENGNPTFRNARYLVERGDWDQLAADDPPSNSFTRDFEPLVQAGCLEPIDLDYRLTDSLLATSIPGHTPGHLGVSIESEGDRCLLIGDAMLSAIDIEEPDWENTYDRDSDTARQTRLTLVEELEANSSLVGATHLPVPSLGHIVSDQGGRVWRTLGS